MKFIRLCEDEIATLKMMGSHYQNSFVRERAQAVIMNHNGIEAKQIADVFSVKVRAVYSWLKSYQDKGFLGLYTKQGQGRKSFFSTLSLEEQKHILDKIDRGDSVKETTCFINENLSENVTERMLKTFLKKRLHMEKNKMLAQTSPKSRRISSESRAIEEFNALGER
jgi:transposase